MAGYCVCPLQCASPPQPAPHPTPSYPPPPPAPHRAVKKVPELMEQFVDRAAELLTDRNHAVMLAGATLMLQVCV